MIEFDILESSTINIYILYSKLKYNYRIMVQGIKSLEYPNRLRL